MHTHTSCVPTLNQTTFNKVIRTNQTTQPQQALPNFFFISLVDVFTKNTTFTKATVKVSARIHIRL